MKRLLIKIIKIYQGIPGNFHNYCRHIPSCSNYAILAIEEHGALKGSILSFIRILKCNPFGSSGVDLVKKRKKGVKNE